MSNETAPLQALLDLLNVNLPGRLTQQESALPILANAVADLTRRVTLLEAPVVIPPPVVDPQIQWKAGMEMGNLSEWSEQVNSGTALSTAVQAVTEGIPGRSTWVMKQSTTPSASSAGTRMARYPEINALAKAGTPFYYTWWDFFPTALTLNASGWYNHWQLASNSSTTSLADPIWVLGFNGSGMTMSLDWSPNNKAPAEGPHAGETGSKHYVSNIAVPVGQWVKFEAFVRPASDFTGSLKIRMNDVVLFDMFSIKTQFPFASQPIYALVDNNCYGVGLNPTPFVHYVDDVTLSLGRMS